MKLPRFTLADLLPLLAVVLRVASHATADLSYFVVALFALRGRSQAIQALALSWLFSMLNGGIMPGGPLASIGRYSVIACAAVRVLIFTRQNNKSMMTGTLLLGAFLVLHSVLFSAVVDVSILKAVVWAVSMATLSAAWAGLAPTDRESLIELIFQGLTVILLLSLPLLAHPLGYRASGTGFQGILGHPQEFGVTMALLSVWLIAKVLVQKEPTWLSLGLLGVSMLLVGLSEARTGALALLLGSTIAAVLITVQSGTHLGARFPGLRSRKVCLTLAVGFICAILSAGVLADKLTGFVRKRSNTTSLAKAYEVSRGGLMDEMWANIQDKPFEGIGFGVASNLQKMKIVRDPVLGLPVSAIIEKGVLPLAVLEELGLMGLMLVVLWLWQLLWRSARGGFLPLALCLTALLLNMGESMLFSTSGMGLLVLVLLGWGSSFSINYRVAD